MPLLAFLVANIFRLWPPRVCLCSVFFRSTFLSLVAPSDWFFSDVSLFPPEELVFVSEEALFDFEENFWLFSFCFPEFLFSFAKFLCAEFSPFFSDFLLLEGLWVLCEELCLGLPLECLLALPPRLAKYSCRFRNRSAARARTTSGFSTKSRRPNLCRGLKFNKLFR